MSTLPDSTAVRGICSQGSRISFAWPPGYAGHGNSCLDETWRAGRRHRIGGTPACGWYAGLRVATGSFAEYAKAKERKLAQRPDGLSPVEAAVLGISGMTALQAIDAARAKAGSRLLIIGASGGVGSYAARSPTVRSTRDRRIACRQG